MTVEPEDPASRADTGAEPTSEQLLGEAQSPPDLGPSAVEKFNTLVRERPEVGLGLAFVVGVIIATILKRLAR